MRYLCSHTYSAVYLLYSFFFFFCDRLCRLLIRGLFVAVFCVAWACVCFLHISCLGLDSPLLVHERTNATNVRRERVQNPNVRSSRYSESYVCSGIDAMSWQRRGRREQPIVDGIYDHVNITCSASHSALLRAVRSRTSGFRHSFITSLPLCVNKTVHYIVCVL